MTSKDVAVSSRRSGALLRGSETPILHDRHAETVPDSLPGCELFPDTLPVLDSALLSAWLTPAFLA